MSGTDYTGFGKKVVIRLIEVNMTQKELADEIGCTRQYLHKILVGERSGKKYTDNICNALGIVYNEG